MTARVSPARTAALVPLLLLSCLGPPVLFGMSYLVPNPERYLTSPGSDVPLFFSRDPLGSVLEMSFANFSTQRLLSGEFPLWNPYSGLGHPFFPDTTISALAAPLNLLRVLLQPADWSIIFIANIVLGGCFTYLLVRSHGASRDAGVLAGVSFFALGTTQVYTAVSSIILVYSWLPLALYGVERGLSPGSSRFRWVPATLGVYGLLTSGHTTITLLCGFVLGLYLVGRLHGSDWRSAARTILWLSTGVLLAAPQWLPFVKYLFEYGNHFEDYSAGRFRAIHLPAWVLPHIYGSLNSDRSIIVNSPWLGIHSSLGWIPPTLGFLLVAGGIALVRQRPRGPLALAAAVVPVYFWAFDLPPLTWLAGLPYVLRIQPHYLPLIGSVLVCVIVGIGYDYLMRCQPSTTALAGGVWLALMALALVAATVWMHTADVPVASVFSALTVRTAISFVWAAVTPAVVYWRWGGGAALSGLVALSAIGYFPWAWQAPVDRASQLALAVGVAMFTVAWIVQRTTATTRWVTTSAVLAPVVLHIVLGTTQNRLPARHVLYEPPAYASFLKAKVGSWRSFGLGGYLFPNYGAVSRINSINAIAAMFPRPAERLFGKYLNPQEKPTHLLGLGQTRPDGTVREPWQEVLNRRSMWDHLGVRYFVHRGGDLSEAKAPILRYDWVGGESDFAKGTLLPLLDGGRPRTVGATLDCTAGPVDAVAVRFVTEGTAPAGLVEMQVLAPGGAVLGRVRRDAARIRHNAFYEFVFPASVCSGGATRLALRLRFAPRPPVRSLAVWQPVDSPGFGFRPLRLRQVSSTGLSGGVAPIPLTAGLEAPFVCPAAPLHALQVYAGTYRRTNPGTLRVRIGDSSGAERYATTLDSAQIRDVQGVRLTVPSGICSAGERLQLDVTHQPAGVGSRVALLAEQDQPFKYELYTDSRSGIVRRFDDPQTGATVWENLQAQPRAYLAAEARHAPNWEAALDAFATSADLRRVAWFDGGSPLPCPSASPVSPSALPGTITNVTVGLNHVDVAVDASMPGTLVLTDAYMPGWSATLDGTAQPVVRVNGVFRGVCIPSGGAHTVRFSYFPPGLLQGGVLALLGVAMATTFSRRSTAGSR